MPGRYRADHVLAGGCEATGGFRPERVGKPARFGDRITVCPGCPGCTDDRAAIALATRDRDDVLVVLASWGVQDHASGRVG